MSNRYAIVLVKNEKGEHLIGVRRDTGKHNFPAGEINDQEDPADGAKRELFEETGFTAKTLKLVKCSFERKRDNKIILLYLYEATVSGSPTLMNDPDKEFQTIMFEDVSKIPKDKWHVPVDKNLALKYLS